MAKNHTYKRLISILIALCLLLTPMVSFGAEESTYTDYADSLAPLGIFLGTNAGYELDRAPTRVEGLIMLIRLLGVEEEALSMSDYETPFQDVPKWANGYVAYAYQNNLTNGISETKFGSLDSINAKAYTTFLLRSLGYSDFMGDFSYDNAIAFALGIGLFNNTTHKSLLNDKFLRAHVAKTSYDALNFGFRGENTKLIDRLMSEGKVDKDLGNSFKNTKLTDPQLLPVTPPKSGILHDYSKGKKEAKLSISAELDLNYYYVKVIDVTTNKSIMDIFVNRHEKFMSMIPVGTYTFKYATGDIWYGEGHLFGSNTSYFMTDKIFEFSKKTTKHGGSAIQGWNIRFYPESHDVSQLPVSPIMPTNF